MARTDSKRRSRAPVFWRGEVLGLRAVTAADAALITSKDPFNDFGAIDSDRTGMSPNNDAIVFRLEDDAPVGSVSWRLVRYGPNLESRGWNIGIEIAPEQRGRGYGSQAQRILAEYLFEVSAANRVEASTDITNVAEQRALEKAGYTREGVLRGAQFRQGEWHDLVVYAILRSDTERDQTSQR